MRKKTRKFKLRTVPRYLVGTVSPDVWKADLAEYNNLRYKVFTAKAKVDTKPPKMNPLDYVDQRKLSRDAERLRRIELENRNLLKQISIINRTIGRIDSYNPDAYAVKSRWNAHLLRNKMIEVKNKAIYKKITLAGSNYSCKKMNEYWRGMIEKLTLSSRFPLVILQKVSLDSILTKQPSISTGLEKISDRPLCFLEFSIKDGLFLGRIVVELYHDHVPVTVQNFLAICTGENKANLTYKNCLVHRIVPGKFLETGDIIKGTGRGGLSIYGKYFCEEGHLLKHTKIGVLSMVRVRKHDNNSKFCITFNNLESMDRQNVVFGKIIKGNENLMKIEGYGRLIGKPLAPIVISDCGKL